MSEYFVTTEIQKTNFGSPAITLGMKLQVLRMGDDCREKGLAKYRTENHHSH